MADRTLQDVQNDYTHACAQLGNLEYQTEVASRSIDANEQEKEKLIKKMKKLNQEGAELAAKKPEVVSASQDLKAENILPAVTNE